MTDTASHARLAGELQDLLGQKLVAFALGERDPKSIALYACGERAPEPAVRERLASLHGVVETLRGGMGEGAIRAWLTGGNPRLAGKAPIEAVHEGHASEVMGAAKALLKP